MVNLYFFVSINYICHPKINIYIYIYSIYYKIVEIIISVIFILLFIQIKLICNVNDLFPACDVKYLSLRKIAGHIFYASAKENYDKEDILL